LSYKIIFLKQQLSHCLGKAVRRVAPAHHVAELSA